jgi:hypothetical protein
MGGSDTVTQGLPEFMQPYAENFMQRTQQVADMPYTPYTGATVAQMNPYQSGGLNAMAQRAIQGSPVMGGANAEALKTLQGGYLNSNPHLDKMVDMASRDVMRNMDTLNARSGSFGNSGVMETTARTLGDLSSSIRGQDYTRERGFMQNALGMAPTLANQDYTDADRLLQAGAGFQGQEQANLSDAYRRFTEAQNYPRQQLATLGQGVGMNFGSTQTGPGQDPLAPLLSAGLMGAGMYFGGPMGAAAGASAGKAAGGK